MYAKDYFRGFGSARSQQTGKSDDFTRPDLQVKRRDGIFFAIACKRHNWLITMEGTARPLERMLIQLPAQHHFNQLNLGKFAGITRTDECAIAQYRNTIADLINLIEEMGHEDQANSIIA